MSAPALPDSKIVHVYDDIEEEDNHLPNWWLAILFGAVAGAMGVWVAYLLAGAMLLAAGLSGAVYARVRPQVLDLSRAWAKTPVPR